MMWLTTIGLLVAVFRILLILFGLCAIVKTLCDHFTTTCCLQETRRKFFLGAGILYLLGLLPHAVILLLSVPPNSPESYTFSACQSNQNVQSEPIMCWCQRIACAFSCSIHVVSYLCYIVEPALNNPQQNIMAKWQRKSILRAIMLFFIIIAICQNFWLWPDSELMQWTYISNQQGVLIESNRDEENTTEIFETVVKQEILVEFVPCSEKLFSRKLKSYIFFSSISSFSVGIVLLATKFALPTVTCFSYQKKKLIEEENFAIQSKESESNETHQCACTVSEPQLDGMLNSLTLTILSWVLLLRPLTVAVWNLFSDHFVDFGTHLLLTLNVLIPLTYSTKREAF